MAGHQDVQALMEQLRAAEAEGGVDEEVACRLRVRL